MSAQQAQQPAAAGQAQGEEEVWHPSEALATDSAARKLWLVKVPAFVAKRWKACSEQAAERGDAVGRPLATLRFEQGEEGGVPRTTYHLKLDAGLGGGVPQDYLLRNTTKNGDPMLAFSDRGGELTAEGKVWQKFDAEVARRGAPGAGAGGKVQLDPEYRKLSRERQAAAAAKTRTVQYLQDTKLVGAPSTVQIGQKRKETSEKRDRMEERALQAILFRLFEKQPRWSFAQLQKDTHQPTAHLKEVLAGIAVKNPRGPYKDLWELKREYKVGGADEQQQQQQQQQLPGP